MYFYILSRMSFLSQHHISVTLHLFTVGLVYQLQFVAVYTLCLLYPTILHLCEYVIGHKNKGTYLRMYSFTLYSDAAQMIFSMHCCLHLIGQPVSVGRLDQLLFPYYKKDIEDKKLTTEMVYMLNFTCDL